MSHELQRRDKAARRQLAGPLRQSRTCGPDTWPEFGLGKAEDEVCSSCGSLILNCILTKLATVLCVTRVPGPPWKEVT